MLAQAREKSWHLCLDHRALALVSLLGREIVHVNQIDLPVLETRFAEQAGIRAAYY